MHFHAIISIELVILFYVSIKILLEAPLDPS